MTNSRFEDLERRCKKIKNRKIIKFVIYIIFLSTFVVLLFYLAGNKYLKQDKVPNAKKTVLNNKKKIILNNVKKTILDNKNKKKTVKNSKKATLKLEPVIELPKILPQRKITKQAKSKSNKSVQKPIVVPSKKETIEKKETQKPAFRIIAKDANKETILLKNYSINKDFSSALKLAEYYFWQKNYKKAIYWSKNANKLDSAKDDSWIIYAKSKYALGEKDDAIESLKTFLNIFYSKRANELLKRYQKGQK